MTAKYVITELENGWVLNIDGRDIYYECLTDIFDAIRSEEKEE